jgi:hypothetical protein
MLPIAASTPVSQQQQELMSVTSSQVPTVVDQSCSSVCFASWLGLFDV